MKLRWPYKDPDEVLDYRIDWLGTSSKPGPLLDSGDTISNSLWIVPDGISKENEMNDDGSTTIWLSGGIADQTYEIMNRITTAGGRTMDQTVELLVKDK